MKNHHLIQFLKWILAFIIVIVISLVFHYAIASLYKTPDTSTFCPVQPAIYTDATTCVNNGGQWTNFELTPDQITTNIQTGQPLGTCNPNYTCMNNFNHAVSTHNKNAFIILIVLSLVVLVAGFFIPFQAISWGFMWGGALSLVVATFEYWGDASSASKLVILIIVLIFLVWIGTGRFGKTRHVDVDHHSK